ncbi:hypothetical protein L916_06895 [Phytophthora nicotianae]|uniref:Uncharacterized protein n=1 Tax=Phytophthora nicotianae TaxID=4792 RepID=W2J756_PHYNI|nr:hypothetical protein L916_06895 [Phytophthora nicotianae]
MLHTTSVSSWGWQPPTATAGCASSTRTLTMVGLSALELQPETLCAGDILIDSSIFAAHSWLATHEDTALAW